ncbi:hypothetical protein PT974_01171 [Cladobotryum mycophilum]|uniref:Uncharacterized protein n=1 Tax=Cladobotryum mycophilum TaxID=491253 RepID=A0ABR0T2W8_9HYPO
MVLRTDTPRRTKANKRLRSNEKHFHVALIICLSQAGLSICFDPKFWAYTCTSITRSPGVMSGGIMLSLVLFDWVCYCKSTSDKARREVMAGQNSQANLENVPRASTSQESGVSEATVIQKSGTVEEHGSEDEMDVSETDRLYVGH